MIPNTFEFFFTKRFITCFSIYILYNLYLKYVYTYTYIKLTIDVRTVDFDKKKKKLNYF